MLTEWMPLGVSWGEFQRVEWEENAGAPFGRASQVRGIAFDYNAGREAPSSGAIWVDDQQLQSRHEQVSPIVTQAQVAAQGEPVEASRRPCLPCLGGILPLSALALMALAQRRN